MDNTEKNVTVVLNESIPILINSYLLVIVAFLSLLISLGKFKGSDIDLIFPQKVNH